MLKHITNKSERMLRLNLQFFAEGGDNAAASAEAAGTAGAAATDTQTGNNANTENQQESNNNPLTKEALEKIIQSRVDKATAELGKKYALAQKENEQLKKDKMSADELAKYELEQEKKSLAAERKELAEKTNKLIAINELTKVGLYDGSDTANSLLNMVVNGAKEESEILENVKAIKSVVDNLVAAQVKKTFKENGRMPNGGNTNNSEANNENNFAAELGKKKAESAKQANAILNHYYGGKK